MNPLVRDMTLEALWAFARRVAVAAASHGAEDLVAEHLGVEDLDLLAELVEEQLTTPSAAPPSASLNARTAYICAPYGAPTAEGRAENCRRARELAAFAVENGLAPVMVHHDIEAGVFGDDADTKQRQRGLNLACAIAVQCDEMWVLEVDEEGGLSSGCAAELEVFKAAHGDSRHVHRFHPAWRGWVGGGA